MIWRRFRYRRLIGLRKVSDTDADDFAIFGDIDDYFLPGRYYLITRLKMPAAYGAAFCAAAVPGEHFSHLPPQSSMS